MLSKLKTLLLGKPAQILNAPALPPRFTTHKHTLNMGGAAPIIRPPVPTYQPTKPSKAWHLNRDRTAAVSDTEEWLPIDKDTPKGVTIQLLNQGGVHISGKYYGESFWAGWAPVPKKPVTPSKLGN